MLQDAFCRRFKYVRLSVTEACNFRCQYCLPSGYKATVPHKTFLTIREIENLAFALADLGVEKVRLTGGEPTLRRDLEEVVDLLKNKIHIKKVALTTNGSRLRNRIKKLKEIGLDSINISLDSLNPEKFQQITGYCSSLEITDLVDQSIALGFDEVKVNTVLLAGLNESEFFTLVDWGKTRQISLRFIELMQTQRDDAFFETHHLRNTGFKEKLTAIGWRPIPKSELDGPAVSFAHENFPGKIGFISPYEKSFCESCNRLRISALGELKLCLWNNEDFSLRSLLQSPSQKEMLKTQILNNLSRKPEKHRLLETYTQKLSSLSAIGG